MGKKYSIGLIYTHNPGWIGGTYYIQNLVHALNVLPQRDTFTVSLFYEKESDLTYFHTAGCHADAYYCLNDRSLWGKINSAVFTRWGWRLGGMDFSQVADCIFPYFHHSRLQSINNKIFWIPDFQAYDMPSNFSEDERKYLLHRHTAITSAPHKLVLSSRHALSSLQTHFPDYRCIPCVIPFAVTLPRASDNTARVMEKYGMDGPYFICPNQLWKHKNQAVVVEAVRLLKEQGKEITVIFTGKEQDPRNPSYPETLRQIVEENRLNEHCRFLGFIPREDQIALMKHSLAIVQPSTYEGWSTVVEDGKALGKTVIASNLPVHREQLDDDGIYFNPDSGSDLATLLSGTYPDSDPSAYNLDILRFGESFLRFIQQG